MAQYASEKLGAKTAAVIFETGSDYSVGLKDAFVEKCGELGVEVVAAEGYSKGDVDFKAQMTNIASKNPDVVFSPNYYQDDGMIVTQARAAGVTGTFLGGDGWGSVKDYASAEDLEGSVYCSGYAPGSNDAVKKFEADYEAKYGEAIPNMFAPLGYDARPAAGRGPEGRRGRRAGSRLRRLQAGRDRRHQGHQRGRGHHRLLCVRRVQQPHQICRDDQADWRRRGLHRALLIRERNNCKEQLCRGEEHLFP